MCQKFGSEQFDYKKIIGSWVGSNQISDHQTLYVIFES